MGAVTNTARNITTGVAKHGLGAGTKGSTTISAIRGNTIGLRNFTDNVTQNLNSGSKATPIVRECRNVTEGIEQGDFSKAAVDAGVVGVTAQLAGVSGTVKTGATKLTANFIAGMSMGMIPFSGASRTNVEYSGQRTNEKAEVASSFQEAA